MPPAGAAPPPALNVLVVPHCGGGVPAELLICLFAPAPPKRLNHPAAACVDEYLVSKITSHSLRPDITSVCLPSVTPVSIRVLIGVPFSYFSTILFDHEPLIAVVGTTITLSLFSIMISTFAVI